MQSICTNIFSSSNLVEIVWIPFTPLDSLQLTLPTASQGIATPVARNFNGEVKVIYQACPFRFSSGLELYFQKLFFLITIHP
jgi:hypothetical protein